MTTTRSLYLAVAGVSLVLAAYQNPPGASQSAASGPSVGASDLGGTVTSAGVLKFQLRPDPLAN